MGGKWPCFLWCIYIVVLTQLGKKIPFYLIRSVFHMIDNQSITVHTLTKKIIKLIYQLTPVQCLTVFHNLIHILMILLSLFNWNHFSFIYLFFAVLKKDLKSIGNNSKKIPGLIKNPTDSENEFFQTVTVSYAMQEGVPNSQPVGHMQLAGHLQLLFLLSKFSHCLLMLIV